MPRRYSGESFRGSKRVVSCINISDDMIIFMSYAIFNICCGFVKKLSRKPKFTQVPIMGIKNPVELMICSKFAPKLTDSRRTISCHYLKSGQSACMFCISHGFQCRQDRRYIAVTCTLLLKSGNDDITTFLRPLKVHRCWRGIKLY